MDVMANDSLSGGEAITGVIATTSGGTKGTFSINAAGTTVIYTPDFSTYGYTDTTTYTLSDVAVPQILM